MKKLIIPFMILAFCSGCGTLATESGFWKHSSNFKNWDHTMFSLWGYKHCNEQTAKESRDQDWWGLDVKECPTE